MSWNPNLILYACVAKGVTILAEFNSKDADLADLAMKCLHKTPPFHTTFSHTVHAKTYMFLIHDPFVYFGIFDETLENPECLSFLNSVKDSFTSIIDIKNLDSLSSHCFQGEFNPVFHQLLAANTEFDMLSPVVMKDDNNESSESVKGKKIGSKPSLGDSISKGLKMKKKRFFEKGGLKENKLDVLSDDDASVSVGVKFRRTDLQTAKHIWKKQVIMILSMDFVVCVALFAIWLWVCNGFQCIAN